MASTDSSLSKVYLLKLHTIILPCPNYLIGANAKDFEATIKHPLFPDNAFLVTLPQWHFGEGFPVDELHALILGIFGEHLMTAIIHL